MTTYNKGFKWFISGDVTCLQCDLLWGRSRKWQSLTSPSFGFPYVAFAYKEKKKSNLTITFNYYILSAIKEDKSSLLYISLKLPTFQFVVLLLNSTN